MKKPSAEMVCYCFHHTRGDIEEDFRQNGRSLILEKIITAKRLGACRCAAQHPRGT